MHSRHLDLKHLLTRNRLEDFKREARRVMSQLHRPSNAKDSSFFIHADPDPWDVNVTPSFPSPPLQYVMSNYFKNGFPEEYIAVILKEILKDLVFLHQEGLPHKGVSVSNIFFNHGQVTLSDFAWAAPTNGILASDHVSQTDISDFGITALELAHGMPLPSSLQIPCSSLSVPFMKMVMSCLDPNPAKRPTAVKLLKENEFFANPNLPTLNHLFSSIKQLVWNSYYRISLPLAEEESQSTVDVQADIVPTQTSTQLLLAPADSHPTSSADGTQPTKLMGTQTFQGVYAPSLSASVVAEVSQVTSQTSGFLASEFTSTNWGWGDAAPESTGG